MRRNVRQPHWECCTESAIVVPDGLFGPDLPFTIELPALSAKSQHAVELRGLTDPQAKLFDLRSTNHEIFSLSGFGTILVPLALFTSSIPLRMWRWTVLSDFPVLMAYSPIVIQRGGAVSCTASSFFSSETRRAKTFSSMSLDTIVISTLMGEFSLVFTAFQPRAIGHDCAAWAAAAGPEWALERARGLVCVGNGRAGWFAGFVSVGSPARPEWR
jgi:hypothetical protein